MRGCLNFLASRGAYKFCHFSPFLSRPDSQKHPEPSKNCSERPISLTWNRFYHIFYTQKFIPTKKWVLQSFMSRKYHDLRRLRRCTVERTFGVLKRLYGLVKARYLGLARNQARVSLIAMALIFNKPVNRFKGLVCAKCGWTNKIMKLCCDIAVKKRYFAMIRLKKC